MEDCIFCKIIRGELPCYKIYGDNEFLAFLDIFPFSQGHTVVIPKKHYRWVWDVENGGKYFEICQKIANHFQKISGRELITSVILGEEVHHAHIHILPNMDGEVLFKTVNISSIKRIQIEKNEAEQLVEKLKL